MDISYWWGLVVVAVALIGYGFYDWNKTKKIIRGMILQAEKSARDLALDTGEEKFTWVKENTYHLIPTIIRKVLTEDMYTQLIQNIYDTLRAWAEKQPIGGDQD